MTKRGFSLIELLVVISIIGIVIAVGSVSYLTAQKQVRDTKRKSDLLEIRQALETYRAEVGTYPDTATWIADLSPDYITALPTDPNGSNYDYLVGATGTTYSLCTTLEIAPASPNLSSCTAPANYEVQNP